MPQYAGGTSNGLAIAPAGGVPADITVPQSGVAPAAIGDSVFPFAEFNLVVAGDIILVCAQATGANACTIAGGTNVTWANCGTQQVGAGGDRFIAFMGIVTGTISTDVIVSSVSNTGTYCCWAAFRGVHANVYDIPPISATGAGNAAEVIAGCGNTLRTKTANVIIAGEGEDGAFDGGGISTATTGYTTIRRGGSNTGSDGTYFIAWKIQAAAGAQDTATVNNNQLALILATHVALRPKLVPA